MNIYNAIILPQLTYCNNSYFGQYIQNKSIQDLRCRNVQLGKLQIVNICLQACHYLYAEKYSCVLFDQTEYIHIHV